MKRIIIVHQWMAGVNGDWRPWLASELHRKGYEVIMPEMPDIDVPVIEKWVSKLSEAVGEPDENTFFVGHSIGCQTILRYLDTHKFENQKRVGGAVFVAGWFNLENLEDKETEKIAEPWIKTPIDLNKVKSVLPISTLIISDNDPFGCFEQNKELFGDIGSSIVEVKNGGHLSSEDGYSEFPLLLDETEKLFH